MIMMFPQRREKANVDRVGGHLQGEVTLVARPIAVLVQGVPGHIYIYIGPMGPSAVSIYAIYIAVPIAGQHDRI